MSHGAFVTGWLRTEQVRACICSSPSISTALQPLVDFRVYYAHGTRHTRFDRPIQLVDWVNVDVFEAIQWTSDRPVYLSTRIWDHQVVITAEEVRIYASTDSLI